MKGHETDQSTCDERSLYKTDFYTMTCLIYTKTDDYFCIAADTWNTTENDNKIIHKIVFNKKNKIIIGCVGQNAAEYDFDNEDLKKIFPQIVKVTTIAQIFCDGYNGYNAKEIAYLLGCFIEKFITNITNPGFSTKRFTITFLIYALDKSINEPVLWEIKGGKSSGMTVPEEQRKVSIEYLAKIPDIDCLGIYENLFSPLYASSKLTTVDKEKLLDWVIDGVQEQIDIDINKPAEERRVGGTIDWILVDKDWNIETNIKSENQID